MSTSSGGAAGRLLRTATAQQLVPIFQALLRQEPCYEGTFDGSDLVQYWGSPDDEQKQAWQQAWTIAAGPDAVMCDATLAHLAEFVGRKGFNAKPISATQYVTAAAKCGIKTAASILDGNETDGKEVVPATPAGIEAVNIVWEWLASAGMTKGKTRPSVGCFRSVMEGGAELLGYYNDGTVYLREDTATAITKYLLEMALEEVAHYATGAGDMSRDLEDFAFKFATEAKSKC